jgi:hypothetical protein
MMVKLEAEIDELVERRSVRVGGKKIVVERKARGLDEEERKE